MTSELLEYAKRACSAESTVNLIRKAAEQPRESSDILMTIESILEAHDLLQKGDNQ